MKEHKKNIGAIAGVIILIIVIVAAFLWYGFSGGRPAPSETATSTEALTPGLDCGGCVGTLDNGKTIAVIPTSRLTLLLPDSYSKEGLTLTPAGSMGETFGASAPAGAWVRTFEATTVGTTTISVPQVERGAPYTLRVVTLPASLAWENGFTIVSEDDRNKTLEFPRNERFIIEMGGGLDWTLSFDPSGVVTRVPNSTTSGDIEGVYEASAVGTTSLKAVGRPQCKTGEACPQYLVEIPITLVVE